MYIIHPDFVRLYMRVYICVFKIRGWEGEGDIVAVSGKFPRLYLRAITRNENGNEVVNLLAPISDSESQSSSLSLYPPRAAL